MTTLCFVFIHAAGGPFADLRFHGEGGRARITMAWCSDSKHSRGRQVSKPSFRMSAAGVDGLPLGDLRLDRFMICRLWVGITGLIFWILHGILPAYLGSNALILFAWILRRFRCGAFHMNGGWVLPLFGPWKGWFFVRGGFIPELSDEGHGCASIQRSPQEEEVEVSEGSGAEIKWNTKQSCKRLYVSLLLWLREGGQQEALLIPPQTPTQKEKGVHVCWRGHHWWLLHLGVCVIGSPGGKPWRTPPYTSRLSLWRLFFFFFCFELVLIGVFQQKSRLIKDAKLHIWRLTCYRSHAF